MAFNFSRADGNDGREEPPPPPPAVSSNNTDVGSTAEAGAEDRSPSAQGDVLRRPDALVAAFGGFGFGSGPPNNFNAGHARPTSAIAARLADDFAAATVGNRPSSSSVLPTSFSPASAATAFGGGVGGMTQPGWATGFNFANTGQSNMTSGGNNERTNPTIPAPSPFGPPAPTPAPTPAPAPAPAPFGAQTFSGVNSNGGGAGTTGIPGGVDPNGGRTLPSPPAPSTVFTAGGPFAALALSFGCGSPPHPGQLAFGGGSPPARQSVGGTGGTGLGLGLGLGLGHGGTNNATGSGIVDPGAGGIRGAGGTPTRYTPAPPFGGFSTSPPNAGTTPSRSANSGNGRAPESQNHNASADGTPTRYTPAPPFGGFSTSPPNARTSPGRSDSETASSGFRPFAWQSNTGSMVGGTNNGVGSNLASTMALSRFPTAASFPFAGAPVTGTTGTAIPSMSTAPGTGGIGGSIANNGTNNLSFGQGIGIQAQNGVPNVVSGPFSQREQQQQHQQQLREPTNMHQLEHNFAQLFQTGGHTGRSSVMSAESRATTNTAPALGTSTAHLGCNIAGSKDSPSADARGTARSNTVAPVLANAGETSSTVSSTNVPPIEASSVTASMSGTTTDCPPIIRFRNNLLHLRDAVTEDGDVSAFDGFSFLSFVQEHHPEVEPALDAVLRSLQVEEEIRAGAPRTEESPIVRQINDVRDLLDSIIANDDSVRLFQREQEQPQPHQPQPAAFPGVTAPEVPNTFGSPNSMSSGQGPSPAPAAVIANRHGNSLAPIPESSSVATPTSGATANSPLTSIRQFKKNLLHLREAVTEDGAVSAFDGSSFPSFLRERHPQVAAALDVLLGSLQAEEENGTGAPRTEESPIVRQIHDVLNLLDSIIANDYPVDGGAGGRRNGNGGSAGGAPSTNDIASALDASTVGGAVDPPPADAPTNGRGVPLTSGPDAQRYSVTSVPDGATMINLQSISGMREYSSWSVDELRLADLGGLLRHTRNRNHTTGGNGNGNGGNDGDGNGAMGVGLQSGGPDSSTEAPSAQASASSQSPLPVTAGGGSPTPNTSSLRITSPPTPEAIASSPRRSVRRVPDVQAPATPTITSPSTAADTAAANDNNNSSVRPISTDMLSTQGQSRGNAPGPSLQSNARHQRLTPRRANRNNRIRTPDRTVATRTFASNRFTPGGQRNARRLQLQENQHRRRQETQMSRRELVPDNDSPNSINAVCNGMRNNDEEDSDRDEATAAAAATFAGDGGNGGGGGGLARGRGGETDYSQYNVPELQVMLWGLVQANPNDTRTKSQIFSMKRAELIADLRAYYRGAYDE